jgi:hypothetical protein
MSVWALTALLVAGRQGRFTGADPRPRAVRSRLTRPTQSLPLQPKFFLGWPRSTATVSEARARSGPLDDEFGSGSTR